MPSIDRHFVGNLDLIEERCREAQLLVATLDRLTALCRTRGLARSRARALDAATALRARPRVRPAGGFARRREQALRLASLLERAVRPLPRSGRASAGAAQRWRATRARRRRYRGARAWRCPRRGDGRLVRARSPCGRECARRDLRCRLRAAASPWDEDDCQRCGLELERARDTPYTRCRQREHRSRVTRQRSIVAMAHDEPPFRMNKQ